MHKRKTNDSFRAVRSSWVMSLAAHLREEHNLNRSEALKKAHATFSLLEELHLGIVEFVYRKEDGTTRQARGTLKKGIAPDFDNYESKGTGNHRDNWNTEGIYTYWDLDRNAFRTFKAKNLEAHPQPLPRGRGVWEGDQTATNNQNE